MTTTPSPRAPAPASLLAPPSARFPWPTLPVNEILLNRYLDACEVFGVEYELGAKADAGGARLTAYPPAYRAIDCSGWVRAALAYATGGALVLPDGSVNQHDWCEARGLKRSTAPALGLDDGALRIGFYVPSPAHPIGHVFLCRGKRTLESCAGHGPCRLPWLYRMLRTSAVYILTPPG